MISFIRGILREKEYDNVTIDCNGVGFLVFVTNSCMASLPNVDEEVTIPTYMVVKEDEMSLYGFVSREEKRLFLELISVSGVGPKTAIQILSAERMSAIVSSIINEDVKVIAGCKGIGRKTAERIIVELKDKIKPFDYIISSESAVVVDNTNLDDAVVVLSSLGIPKTRATQLAREVMTDTDSAEEIVAKVLRQLGN